MREDGISQTGRPARGRLVWLALGLFAGLTLAGFLLVQELLGAGIPRLDPRLLRPAALGWIGLFLAIYFVADGLRLHFVLRTLGAPVRAAQLFPLVFINILFSNVTPMATGGGFAQVWYLQRRGVPVGISAAATTIRTVLAMLAIFIAAPLFQFVLVPAAGGMLGAVMQGVSLLIALYLAGFVIVLFRPYWIAVAAARLLAALERRGLIEAPRRERWSHAIARETAGFAEGFRRFMRGPRLPALGAVAATLVFLLTLFALPALLMALLGHDPDWLAVIGTLSIVTFLMYFAPTPGGAGFSELAFAGLMAGQIDAAHLLLVTFAWRFLTIYLGMAIGLVVSFILLGPARRGA